MVQMSSLDKSKLKNLFCWLRVQCLFFTYPRSNRVSGKRGGKRGFKKKSLVILLILFHVTHFNIFLSLFLFILLFTAIKIHFHPIYFSNKQKEKKRNANLNRTINDNGLSAQPRNYCYSPQQVATDQDRTTTI